MDSALKQRLLGAAVLIALAAIFLPMLLSGPPPQPGERPDIPGLPERALETRRIPLQPPGPGASADALPTLRSVEDGGVATLELESQAPVDAFADDPARAPEPAVTQPPRQAAPPPASAPPVSTAPPAPQTSSVAAVAAPTAAAVAADGRFLLQIGTFTRADNANQLVQRLLAAGVPARAENVTIAGSPQVRVTAGPFATRAAAEQARQDAQRLDRSLNPRVTERRVEASADAPSSALDGRPGGWAVQAGVFSREDNAMQLRDRLRGAGFTAFVEPVATAEGRSWRVRVGPELQRERAEALQRRLRDELGLNGFIVAHP